jgi:hypothetical protein
MRFAPLVIALVLVACVARAQPDPSACYVQSITYGGSGCPQGSVGNSFANDRLAFTLIFDQNVASSGAGVDVTEGSKTCVLTINVFCPAGACYLLDTDSRGYVSLASGVAAEHAVDLVIGDVSTTSSAPFAGPTSVDYVQTSSALSDTPAAQDGLQPVTATFVVHLLDAPTSSAQITLDSIDGRITGVTCPAGPHGLGRRRRGRRRGRVRRHGPGRRRRRERVLDRAALRVCERVAQSRLLRVVRDPRCEGVQASGPHHWCAA